MLTALLPLSLCLTFAATPISAPPEPPPADRATEDRPFVGHKVVRVDIRNQHELRIMLALSPDMWSESAGVGSVDFRIPPDALDAMRDAGLSFSILIDDVQALIDAERERIAAHNAHTPRGVSWFAEYQTLAQINEYLVTLEQASHASTDVHVIDIGLSLQNRATKGLSIVGEGGTRQRPAVYLNSCQHAREWISPMTNIFIADSLVRGYSSNPRITRILDRVRFVVVPVSNPDGYLHTWTAGGRLWRKNRRVNAGGSIGVDLNRNWGYQWGVTGPSPIPSNEQYRGPAPWSEPETVNLRNVFLSNPDIRAHVDIHSYSQYILYPWCFTPNPSPDHALFVSLAAQIADAIASVHSTVYQPGQWYQRLYPSSGTMIDYIYNERDVPSFTFELRDTGAFGFILPADQIIPTGQEILPAILLLAETLYNPADWNGDNIVNSQDLFDFLADFFAQNADFNGSATTNSQDLFDFLAAFLND